MGKNFRNPMKLVAVLALVACAAAVPLTTPATNVNLQVESRSKLLYDMGVEENDEAWNCDWYGDNVPRAAVAMTTCRGYLANRLLNCAEFTKNYSSKHPHAQQHITLDEMYIKCRQVKDTLDQHSVLPGDTASCTWCMLNTNTN
eukprot:c9200_g1_i1.p1 GENE.c9200_g1_i1~~c9200_g1_i1.p1  ORF type:complete len:144 (+),score=17.75 c9200_g1_i1:1-432(+)